MKPVRYIVCIFFTLTALSQTPYPAARTMPLTGPPPEQQQAPAAESRPEDRGSIEGTVLNARTNEPLRKAAIVAFRTDRTEAGPVTPSSASTDGSGHFVINGLDPGRYSVDVSRQGFLRSSAGGRASRSPTVVSVGIRQAVKDLVFRLVPAAVITGRVIDEDGDPVMNAQIRALRYRYMDGRRQLVAAGYAQTDDLGNYRMHSLQAGKYILKAVQQRIGPAPAVTVQGGEEQGYTPVYYPGVLDVTQAAAVAVAEGEEKSGVDLRLTPVRTVRVRGRVLGIPQAGNRNIQVALLERTGLDMADRQFSNTDRSGNFEIRGVVPGSYIVQAVYADRDARMGARRPIEVGHANLENLELVLKMPAEVSGMLRVENAGTSKTSVSDIRVMLRPADQMMFGADMPTVKADGSFTIKNVLEGDYRVVPLSAPDLYVKSVRYGTADITEGTLTVTEAPAPLEIVFSGDGGKLDGTVTDDSKPAPNAVIVLTRGGKVFQNSGPVGGSVVVTDQSGRYTLRNVPPGDYVVYALRDVEPGAWMDPAVIEAVKDKGKSITIQAKGQQTVDLEAVAGAEKQ